MNCHEKHNERKACCIFGNFQSFLLQIFLGAQDKVLSMLEVELVVWSLWTSTVFEYWLVNAFEMDEYQIVHTLPNFTNRLDSKSQIVFCHLVIFIRRVKILSLDAITKCDYMCIITMWNYQCGSSLLSF